LGKTVSGCRIKSCFSFGNFGNDFYDNNFFK
jgi:hypothetical protein